MAEHLIPMKGEEVIRKVLANEKDLQRIKLEERFDFNSHDGFKEMQEFLRYAGLKNNRLNLSGSDFSYCTARGLYLPYVEARGLKLNFSDISSAVLANANLFGSWFYSAVLEKANFNASDLRWSYFDSANLMKTSFIGADLREAIFWKAWLYKANLIRTKCIGADFRTARFKEEQYAMPARKSPIKTKPQQILL